MPATSTVVFADLTGSTALFETLGNDKATQTITRLTLWIGQVCAQHQGRVVKNLGDGVFMVFQDSLQALLAVTEMQRVHHARIERWPEPTRMKLQIGVATGEVLEVDGDSYGDAVNVAARLSDLSGAEQIWATEATVDALPPGTGPRRRSLGPVAIRGKAEPQVIYRIEWQEELLSEFLTVPASLKHLATPAEPRQGSITLSRIDVSTTFDSSQMPVHLGRGEDVAFIVNDPRVSRRHSKIDWVNGAFVLTDVSSYGTWVRFSGSDTELALRRNACVLHGAGEIAMGAPFSDFTVSTVNFKLSG